MSDTIVMHTNSGSASKQETNMNVKELQKWLNTKIKENNLSMKPLVEDGSKFVSASGGVKGAKFANAWKGNTTGRDGEQLGAFQWGNFGAGW